MSFTMSLPPSIVAKMAKTEETGEGTDGDGAKTNRREDWKKMKELEEARKAGTVPAMKDEEGKDINPHIPQYIMQAPWYFGSTQPTLKHQKQQPDTKKAFAGVGQWYRKGVKETVATKFRKGACENCGAVTHKKKDCLERPRKVGAKYTGSDLAPDEYIQPQLDFDYDGKRDYWNGYDISEHKHIVDEFQKLEDAKRQLKAQKLETDILEEEEAERQKKPDDLEDEDKYADHIDMPGQKFETKQRITVRNLRIREDTAKYLFNLDPNSAFYDPKTRSMRENPLVKTGRSASELPYAGDNFVRWSGDAHGMASKQVFAWEAYEKGVDVHLQADPTKLALLSSEYKKKKEDYKKDLKGSIVDKYGGQEHLDAPPKELLLAQTEEYIEYSRHGTVIKGQEKAQVKSRYEEDVYLSNHTSMWGSFWKDGHWGYKCCHQLVKEAYCTGEAGIEAAENPVPAIEDRPADSEEEKPATLVEQHQKRLAKEREKNKKKKQKEKRNKKKKQAQRKKKKQESDSSSSSSSSSSSDSSSEDEGAAKEKEIQKALKVETKRVAEVERIMTLDERKRPYNCMYESKAPTEAEMEAFRRKRLREDDPMAKYLSK